MGQCMQMFERRQRNDGQIIQQPLHLNLPNPIYDAEFQQQAPPPCTRAVPPSQWQALPPCARAVPPSQTRQVVNATQQGKAAEEKEPSRFLVAAIDLGTTFSGYAFSFGHEYQSDRLKISTNLWPHSNGMSLKAPTSVLLGRDLQVKAFGYDALKMFSDVTEYNQQNDHYFYSKFKMNLYHQGGLTLNFPLQDISGKSMLAVDVFAKVIGYLKQHLLDRIKTSDTGINVTSDSIHWVLTVPAIWDDKAKYFMRKAAEKAGIEGRQLTLALEPEAASLFCRYSPTYQSDGHDSEIFDSFKPGTKYMVVDLGGGTVDITVHGVHDSGALEEIYQATGGYWGGSTVDDEFCALIVDLFGSDIYEEMQHKFASELIELFQEFDVKKRTFESGQSSKVSIKIPPSFNELYTVKRGKSIHEVLEELGDNAHVKVKRDKLWISPSRFQQLFDKAISNIVNHVKGLLEHPCVSGVNTLLLVGGFSDSHVVKDAIISAFPHLRIVHPDESSLTVLKGAVLFGHEPRAITARVCKYTYGIAMSVPFKENVHHNHKKRSANGQVICDDVFDIHLKKGQQVLLKDKPKGKSYWAYSGHAHSLLEVYASSDSDPQYVTDSSCTLLGSIVLELSAEFAENDKINVTLNYSGTELEVSACESNTGKHTRAYFDFLG